VSLRGETRIGEPPALAAIIIEQPQTYRTAIDDVVPWIRERGLHFFFIAASRTCIASNPSTRLSVNGSKYVTSGAWRSRWP
jgi:hypothetical protein